MNFFSINTLLVHIPLGKQGYDLSWIEAVGTICGLLCIWWASKEKVINYFFGIINVALFAVIFYQIQLYSSLLLQIFFILANIYGWYAWTRQTPSQQVELQIRWLPARLRWIWGMASAVAILVMTIYIDTIFGAFARLTVTLLNELGLQAQLPVLQPDAYPFWDACMTVLSVVAMILMTRKWVENWILWVIINLISVAIFTLQGVYAMSIEYIILTFIAINGVRLWAQKAAS
ncbi:nicotinamide riboside transporter PnuC [Rosenbergiella australiborealis]|uniref:Nicotinamide riboside transporter PnuC n=1 Tax=Rosenbergiella australiborealis TaxID=1544696 RepID=A0ABS5T3W8_9GAMM|nr:nicotinamide riboside transporter PnuC [Rosenbergiella australiborealis]MBT0727036.1 nicotinamide riboside transporter PnuC [Rosenbergiella australiborealis]